MSVYRKLADGNFVEQLEDAVKLSVITKCPEKYTLIDNENGRVYQGSNEDNPFMPGYKVWKEVK